MENAIRVEIHNPPLDLKKVESILEEYNGILIPPLTSFVNLAEYAKKVAEYATLVCVYEAGILVGYCAVYVNNKEYAYITSIAVQEEKQGNGIGATIWKNVIAEVRKKELTKIMLQVARENKRAIDFYLKQKCEIVKEDSDWLTMQLNI